MAIVSGLRTWLLVLPVTLGANLLLSHFSGQVYSLSYTGDNKNGTLTVKTSSNGCGRMPTWLTLESASRTLYCFDETSGAVGGGGVLTSFSMNSDGSLKQTGQAPTTGGDVHGALYGGADGKGFIAAAE